MLDHRYETSKFKIERFLNISGLRDKYPCTTVKRQRAEKKKKHDKVVVVKNPGVHTQMDVKYQTHLLSNKQKCYVFNFIDHASNWSFKRSYAAVNARNTEDFMNRLIAICPFEIQRLQTDNGIEFTNKYISVFPDEPKEHLLDIFCKKNNINHKLIPPGEKELQGLVERSHRQDDQELFSRINPEHLVKFNDLLEEYWKDRNRKRRFKKLAWLTPDKWLEQYIIQAMVIKLLNRENFETTSNSRALVEISENIEELMGNDEVIDKLAA